jgi:hypothetical protein
MARRSNVQNREVNLLLSRQGSVSKAGFRLALLEKTCR